MKKILLSSLFCLFVCVQTLRAQSKADAQEWIQAKLNKYVSHILVIHEFDERYSYDGHTDENDDIIVGSDEITIYCDKGIGVNKCQIYLKSIKEIAEFEKGIIIYTYPNKIKYHRTFEVGKINPYTDKAYIGVDQADNNCSKIKLFIDFSEEENLFLRFKSAFKDLTENSVESKY